MQIDDIYQEWISSIDLTKTRIVRFPSLVLLCGGTTSESPKKFSSCRDIFCRHIEVTQRLFREKVVLAEQVFEYFKHSAYKDLLNFEKDLAELSALTVIFSESPGSIAEFGSFTVIEPVQERLLVVMHQDDTDKESFIWRGPALYLKELARKNNREDPITIYDWKKSKRLKEKDFPDADHLAETMETILSKIPQTALFNKKQWAHKMLLMLDLLRVIQLATADEITHFMQLLNLNYDRRNVDQHLSLLISLKLAIKKPYGHNVYYLSPPNKPWLSWAFKKTAKIRDVNRWKSIFLDCYSRNNQLQKSRALRSYLKSTGQIGD